MPRRLPTTWAKLTHVPAPAPPPEPSPPAPADGSTDSDEEIEWPSTDEDAPLSGPVLQQVLMEQIEIPRVRAFWDSNCAAYDTYNERRARERMNEQRAVARRELSTNEATANAAREAASIAEEEAEAARNDQRRAAQRRPEALRHHQMVAERQARRARAKAKAEAEGEPGPSHRDHGDDA